MHPDEPVEIVCFPQTATARPLRKNRDSDLGYDVTADADVVIEPGRRVIVPTGLVVATDPAYGFLLRDRSGLARRNGLHVMAGVIEGVYREPWGVLVVNLSESDVKILMGDRIAQAILHKIIPATVRAAAPGELPPPSDRGAAGWGSSGR